MNAWISRAITLAILVVVWNHAHWSVALCLTTLSISSELNAVIEGELVNLTKELALYVLK